MLPPPCFVVATALIALTPHSSVQGQASAAEVHLSHVTTAFEATPGGRGLMEVAIIDGAVARQHAEFAIASGDLPTLKLHARHVLHALDPSGDLKGPATGYGLQRSSAQVITHLRLAARSEGARPGMPAYADAVVRSMESAGVLSVEASSVARRIIASNDLPTARTLASTLRQITSAIANGSDRNGDGVVAVSDGEGGLEQAAADLLLLVDAAA